MSNLEERQALIGEMAEHLKKNIYHSEERKITTPRKEYQAESQKVVSLEEAIRRSGLKDGMTVSFHHHFREGDLVVCMVMEEIHKMGFKNITLSASSLGKAHDALVPMIEDGTILNIESSGVRGKIGDAISHGKLKGLATMRSHGGRVRAIETGETHVDIAFIGAPSCDEYGNCWYKGTMRNFNVVMATAADTVIAECEYIVPVGDIEPENVHTYGMCVNYIVEGDRK